jgi:hypothetical protein
VLLVGYAATLVGLTYLTAAWALRMPEARLATARAGSIVRKLPIIGFLIR